VRIDADGVRVSSDAVASVADGGSVEVRVEGGSSPCALRAAGGEVLAERFVLVFRVAGQPGADLSGPVLVASRPAAGTPDAAPGASVELRFSEPVVVGSDAVTLRVDGVARPAIVRASADRRRVVVRPEVPFAPGASVALDLHRCLTDDVGNPLAAGSPSEVTFRVRQSPLHEIEEEFASDEFLDRTATDCAWGEVGAPGVLVPRCGATPLPAHDAEPTTDLGDRDAVRFQVLVRGDEVRGGVASGLRLRFAQATGDAPLLSAWVEGGPTQADVLAPSFQSNRDDAAVAVLAAHGGDLAWEPAGVAGATVDVPFELPLFLVPGQSVLLDVTLTIAPGARLAAAPDRELRTLVRGAGRERLAPSAALLVSGSAPAARSLWYDAGVDSPQWRPATIEWAGPDGRTGLAVAEFQAAPSDGAGHPVPELASPWEPDLDRLPSWRFVRFRLRFGDVPSDGAPAVERVVLPFETAR
jgi:hypothetical protein